jgi:DNA replication protein DnaC
MIQKNNKKSFLYLLTKISEAKIIINKSTSINKNKKQKTNQKMNTETLEQMKRMKLSGMLRAFTSTLDSEQTTRYTNDELVSFLIQSEWEERQNKSILRLTANAKFRYNASIESLHYEHNRNLDRNQILRYADCSFIANNENILITGSTGIGKSYLATALGYQACMLGYRVLYTNTAKLF